MKNVFLGFNPLFTYLLAKFMIKWPLFKYVRLVINVTKGEECQQEALLGQQYENATYALSPTWR